jgi:hypothetical protein
MKEIDFKLWNEQHDKPKNCIILAEPCKTSYNEHISNFDWTSNPKGDNIFHLDGLRNIDYEMVKNIDSFDSVLKPGIVFIEFYHVPSIKNEDGLSLLKKIDES